ncbi:MAG: zinc ribbon-containing protein [Chromatiaceae bacterium]|nr:zinc ribbon-containing protein [Chromatiaceae bacterium]MCP5318391.1 zinc ribbon-containing protein [Chromatiaceae bacterium]MCP5435767.1 zinc ribbon-containing protein [Chromatiaceae bacterium]MCP5440499.1 zinc ribbon-containing protein [Chromatiaceae bacterium]MCP5441326.1 zinc ribbon-containing protein [Chromatiaceae bacterium]
MSDKQKDPIDRLVGAYEAMLERVHEAAETGEKKTVPWLREALANAREKAVELEELTREEAEKVSRYVERDLHEAASFIADTGQEFRDWLTFDWRLMQNRMLDMFAGMADQTSQALRGFAEQARQASQYHTGEVTAPGVLECSECGEILHFEKTGRIPPCPKCNATTFQRKPAAAP